MKKHFLSIFLFFVFLSSQSFSESITFQDDDHIGWSCGSLSMYCLPQQEIDNHFNLVSENVLERWDTLIGNQIFSLYSPGRDNDSLTKEFNELNNLRLSLWIKDYDQFPCESNPFFKLSQELLLNNKFRQVNCISFEHSLTDPSYNSSCIQIKKRRFFALEGPMDNNVSCFFKLLSNWNVSSLVRLTDDIDHKTGKSKCFPYWTDLVFEKNSQTFLQIPVKAQYETPVSKWGRLVVPYFVWPDWDDHKGVNSEKLVNFINQARNNNTSEDDIIAVHCSAGVGRTGTFIACLCLLDEIDEQLEKGLLPENLQLSIARLFLHLNFYRPWLVSTPSQYITLYRTVEWYLNYKKGDK
ncbi:MAG: hypothetical protein KR126chlam6_01376 [Candidatus Anoxychlamydiales bacterium]|nr:hypothetical protein [Candidatus Anoxychlamydiales bacterium]